MELFIYKARLIKLGYNVWGIRLIAIANTIQIKIANFVYNFVTKYLNKWENYEYDSTYNDVVTFRLFIFRFVNTYTSFFYIAFVKNTFETCIANNCLYEL